MNHTPERSRGEDEPEAFAGTGCWFAARAEATAPNAATTSARMRQRVRTKLPWLVAVAETLAIELLPIRKNDVIEPHHRGAILRRSAGNADFVALFIDSRFHPTRLNMLGLLASTRHSSTPPFLFFTSR